MLMRAAGMEMGVEARGRGTAPGRNVGKQAVSLLVVIGIALAWGTRPSLASGIVSDVSAARGGGGAGGGSRGARGMSAAAGRTSLRLRGGSRATEPRQAESKAEGNIQNFFAFEGLIGAGKSTLLAKLEARGVAVIPEPLKAWQDSGIFAAFYGDMKRWSYTFQTSAFVTRVKAVEDALADKPATRDFVGERSWFADAYVFERLLRKDGHINDVEHAAYQEWWEWLNHKAPATRGIIYLRARPETCLTRIKKRSRTEEAGIPLDYLEGLYEQHEKWLVEKETPYGRETRRVLVIDANPDFEQDEARVEGMIDAIEEFMRKCEAEAILERSRSESVHAMRRTESGTELPKGTIYWDGN